MSSCKIEHYIIGETIGKGGSAKVKGRFSFLKKVQCFLFEFYVKIGLLTWIVAKHEFTGDMVAIKIMKKSKIKEMKLGARIRREINLLRYFNHPNIIKM